MAKEADAKTSPTSATTYYYYYDDFSDEETKGTKCPSSLYIAEGKLHSLKARYKKAIESFNTVLERQPKNVEVLLARSKCYMHQMHYELALEDVEAVLEQNANSADALFQKGEIEYVMGDFEFAYLSFKKGFKNRPAFLDFILCLQKCRDAISNCIGATSRLKVSDVDVTNVEKIIFQKKGLSLPEENKPGVSKHPRIDHKARRILGKAAVDKEFLQEILHGKSIRKGVSRESLLIPEVVQKGLDFLKGREIFWQNVQPLHSREKVRSTLRVPLSKFHRKPQVVEDVFPDLPLGTKAQRMLENATEALGQRETETAIEYCRRLIDLIKEISHDALPSKARLMTACLHVLGLAFYRSADFQSAAHCHEYQLEIAARNLMPEVLRRALRTLYLDYAASEEYSNAIQALKDLMPFSMLDSTKAYVLHEIGYSHLMMNDLEMARENALSSLEFATRAGHSRWQLNSRLLLGKIEVVDCNHSEAIKHYSKALNLTTDSEVKEEIRKLLKKLVLMPV